MFFQKRAELFADDGLHDAFDFGIAELGFGLTFELGFQKFDTDNRRQAFADILAGQIFFIAFEEVVSFSVVVNRPG